MKNQPTNTIVAEDHIGCFGEFRMEDRICKKHCILSLRCAIEREQNDQLEMLEDMFSPEGIFMKMQ